MQGRFYLGVISCIGDVLIIEQDIYVFLTAILDSFVAMIPDKVTYETSPNAALWKAKSFH